MRGVQGGKACLGDMGVDLCSAELGMPQHELHAAQISTMIKEMGGKGVAQAMGRQWTSNSRQARIVTNNLPKTLSRHGASALTKEERRFRAPTQQDWAGMTQIL